MTNLIISAVLTLGVWLHFLRGGNLHNHLVLASQAILRGAGFETHLEHPRQLPDGGLDFIDLMAQRGDFLLCIEVETSARYVLTNARKARQLGLPLVVIVPTRKVRNAVKTKLRKSGIRPGGHAIYVLLLAQLKQEVTNCFPLFSAVSHPGKKIKNPADGKRT